MFVIVICVPCLTISRSAAFSPEGSNTCCVRIPNGIHTWVPTPPCGELPPMARRSLVTRCCHCPAQSSAWMADMEARSVHETCHSSRQLHYLEYYWYSHWFFGFPLGGPDSWVAKCNWYATRLHWPPHTGGTLVLAKSSLYFQLQPPTGWRRQHSHGHTTSTSYHSWYAQSSAANELHA